jgi:two-component system response regulator YesN
LKYEVEDYLLKPVDAEELNGALRKISDEIRGSVPSDTAGSAVIRRFFITKAIYEMEGQAPPFKEINKAYGLYFREGLFRMLLVKLDDTRGRLNISENANSLYRKIESLFEKNTGSLCFETLFDVQDDGGLMILMNYAQESDQEFLASLPDLLVKIKDVVELFKDLRITLCVSETSENIGFIAELSRECLDVAWSRLFLGTNRVITTRDLRAPPLARDPGLKDLLERVRKAFEILDAKEVELLVAQFFHLPPAAICGREGRKFACAVKNYLFDLNGPLIAEFADEDKLRKEFDRKLESAFNIQEYEALFISQITSVLNGIAESRKQKNIKPVRKAMQYVKNNLDRYISLEDVANEVQLSSAYFSNIFKKETGQNFTEFITESKINKAKDLLMRSNMNINEIADSLSFSDARYFSKIFKKVVGIKPTEYRKIYG